VGSVAAGALAGGLAGNAYGKAVAKKKEGYAAQESALDAQISGLRVQVANRRQYNEKLRTLVAAKEQQLSSILASDRSAGPTVQDFDLRTSINVKLREIDEAARSWQETIDAHKAVMEKAKDDPHSGELQTQIDQLSEQRADLLHQRAKLAGLPDRLKP
jgi:chromosome segregation ATPase